ncbi:hypothetical protein D3C87_675500 [compost metagenome]
MKNPFQKSQIRFPIIFFIDFENPESGPSVNRRIHVIKVPFVSWHLSVRVHIPFFRHCNQLGFSEFRINHTKTHAMERQIPSRIPRIFPLVRHRDDVFVVKMLPIAVSDVAFSLNREIRVAFQPFSNVVMIELFIPKQTCKSLSLDISLVLVFNIFLDVGVEIIRILLSVVDDFIKIPKCILHNVRRQSEFKNLVAVRFYDFFAMQRCLGSRFLGINRI